MQTSVACSFLEIYNETLSDLLTPSGSSTSNLALREDGRRGGSVFVEGLREEKVQNVAAVAALLQQGIANRRVGETLMNERSSRSHSVFTATVERRTPGVDGGPDSILRSRLHLVDLAGSERQKTTGAAGDRLKEASSINKSLSALGLVIMSIVDEQQGRQRHIPYRDSKLTTLLRDSLGGNAKTVMIACISPAAVNSAETLGTLRFADSAKRIKNKAVVNEDAEGDAESLRKEVRRLKDELALVRQAAAGSGRHHHDGENGDEPATPVSRGAGGIATELQGNDAEGVQRALLGALRREDAAATQVNGLQEELEGMRALAAAKESELQRAQMMIKLKDSRLSRTALPVDDVVAALTSEIELLKAKFNAPHPEVKRFAVENHHLSQEIARLQAAIDGQELEALGGDIASLRSEMLVLAEKAEVAEEEAVRARAAAAAASVALEKESEALNVAHTRILEHKDAPALQQRIAELESENDELRVAVADAKALREEVDCLYAHTSSVEATCETLREELETTKKEAAEIESAYKGTVEQLSTAWEELSVAEAAQKQAEDALAAEMHAAAEQREENEAAMTRAAASMEHSLQEVMGLKRDLEASRAQAEELSVAVSSVAEERDALVEESVVKEQELESVRVHVSQLETTLVEIKKEVVQAEKKIQQLQEELTKRAVDAAAAATSAAKRIDELEIEIQDAKSNLDAAKSAIDAKTIEIAALQAARDKSAADFSALQTALETTTFEAQTLRGTLSATTERHAREVEQLQEEIRALEGSKDELEYELSDKSATLSETKEQLASVREALHQSKAANENSLAQITEISGELRDVRKAEETASTARLALRKKVFLLEEELRQQEAARCGPLENEQQLLLARAELADTKAKLSSVKGEAVSLAANMRKKEEEVARVRAEMAAEVNDAAQQVQELLAAQARAEAAQARAEALQALVAGQGRTKGGIYTP